jgi:hypothetical protein
LVFAAIGGYATWRIFAAAPNPPSIYLNPASQSYGINTTFVVDVRENSGTTPVNAVQANFTYNATLVDFVSIDATGSAFDIAAPSSGGNGSVSIARGKTTTSVTGDQLVAKVTFKTKAAGGSVAMAFTTGTALVSYSTNTDILGGLGNTGGGTYTIDTTPPTVTVTGPASGASIGLGTTTTITATASDASSTITQADILVDGAVKTTIAGAGPYSYRWNTTGLTLGNHTIQARATDSAGNVGSSSVITVSIADKTAPTAPTNLRVTSLTQTSVQLAWNAATDNIGVVNYRISRGGTTITTLNALTYTDSGLTAGTTYNYSIVALDAAGNISSAATLSAVTQAAKLGDINNDTKVDISDLSILASHWGQTSSDAGYDPNCDLYHDNVISISDLSILAANWAP